MSPQPARCLVTGKFESRRSFYLWIPRFLDIQKVFFEGRVRSVGPFSVGFPGKRFFSCRDVWFVSPCFVFPMEAVEMVLGHSSFIDRLRSESPSTFALPSSGGDPAPRPI